MHACCRLVLSDIDMKKLRVLLGTVALLLLLHAVKLFHGTESGWPPPAIDSRELLQLERKGESAGDSRPSGQVLTLKFTGQMVAGLRGLFSQQCWLTSFNLPMSIVEPWVDRSVIIHSTELWERQEASLRLRNYYTIPNINLTSWEVFLHRAPRKLVILCVKSIHEKNCLRFQGRSCRREPSRRLSTDPSECDSKQTRDAVSYLETRGFSVVREAHVDCSVGSSDMDNMLNPRRFVELVFGGYNPKDVTLLVEAWRFSFHITSNCKYSACLDPISSVQSPHGLDKHVSSYSELVDRLQNHRGEEIETSIAVMVRLEWFLIKHKHNSLQIIHQCLDSIKTLTRALRAGDGGGTRLLLALDVGKYGSGSFNHTQRLNNISSGYFERILAEVKEFVQVLYDGMLSFDDWEESYPRAAGGSTDRSYIATLQSQVASEADCLLLMGGGHFQALALEKYKSHNQPENHCIHTICRDTQPSEQFAL